MCECWESGSKVGIDCRIWEFEDRISAFRTHNHCYKDTSFKRPLDAITFRVMLDAVSVMSVARDPDEAMLLILLSIAGAPPGTVHLGTLVMACLKRRWSAAA